MMRRFSIAHRLMLFVPVLLVALTIVVGFSLSVLRDGLLEDRKEQLRQVVGVARGMLETWHAKEKSGQLTTADAQLAARDQLRQLRFGVSDYFFATRFDGVTMVHANQKFEGQNRIDFKTSDGVETVRLQIEAAKNGGGFYSLMFPRPGETTPVAKIAYAAAFEPWQWSLGTGLYIDDIDTIYNRILTIYLGIVAAVVLVSGAIALTLARSISRPISTMAERMGRLAEGDLAVEVPYLEDRNEVGLLARALEVFKQNRRKADELAAAQEAEQAAKLRRQEAVELTLVDFQEQTSRVIAAVVGAAEQVRSHAGGLAEMRRTAAA